MERDLVLVVDDIEINREILKEILLDDYDVIQASNGFEAIEQIMEHGEKISLVLLDIMMPEMDGYEVLDVMRSGGYLRKIPVIIITAASGDENEIRGLQSGASDFVGKPFSPEVVKCRAASQIELKNHRTHLEMLVEENVQKVVYVRETVLELLASVIEYRHIESGEHVKRTRVMAEHLMRLIKKSRLMDDEMSRININMVAKAVPLHDIGKISTPDHILLKPGKLTNEEFEIMKEHTTRGAQIISELKDIEDPVYLQYCHDICLSHHEKWDGTGYPNKLTGPEIPFVARIMSIVDVYDALTSERVYKAAFTQEEAVKIIDEGKGRAFDPIITQIFIENADSFMDLKMI